MNAHFVAGMLGFSALVAARLYLQAGCGLLGRGLAGVCLSALLHMTAIVNRGITAGAGDGIHGYGRSVLDLFWRYVVLLVNRAFRPSSFGILEASSVVLLVVSLGTLFRATLAADAADKKKK